MLKKKIHDHFLFKEIIAAIQKRGHLRKISLQSHLEENERQLSLYKGMAKTNQLKRNRTTSEKRV